TWHRLPPSVSVSPPRLDVPDLPIGPRIDRRPGASSTLHSHVPSGSNHGAFHHSQASAAAHRATTPLSLGSPRVGARPGASAGRRRLQDDPVAVGIVERHVAPPRGLFDIAEHHSAAGPSAGRTGVTETHRGCTIYPRGVSSDDDEG